MSMKTALQLYLGTVTNGDTVGYGVREPPNPSEVFKELRGAISRLRSKSDHRETRARPGETQPSQNWQPAVQNPRESAFSQAPTLSPVPKAGAESLYSILNGIILGIGKPRSVIALGHCFATQIPIYYRGRCHVMLP